MRKHSIKIGLFVALAFVLPQVAHAQAPYSPFGGTSNYGIYVSAVNATDSTLFSGEVVMIDTTTAATTNVKRIAVRRYLGVLSDRFRIVGVVADDRIAGHNRRGVGRILIWGYHPGVYVNISNAGAKAPLKAGAGAASLAVADSVSMAVGYVIGGVAGTSTVNTGPRYRYRVFWTGVGGKIVGAL